MAALVLSMAAMEAMLGAATMVAEEEKRVELEAAVTYVTVLVEKVTDQAAEISDGSGGKDVDGTGSGVVAASDCGLRCCVE